MSNTAQISAGLPVAKNSGQTPDSQVNTIYISAGLSPAIITGAVSIQDHYAFFKFNGNFLPVKGPVAV